MSLRRLFLLLLLSFVIYVSWSEFGKPANNTDLQQSIENIESKITSVTQSQEFEDAVHTLRDGFVQLVGQIDSAIEQLPKEEQEVESQRLERPNLATPTEDVFTVYNIGLGDTKAEVEKKTGAPKRSSVNEYGVRWSTYHKNYQHFFMVAYDKNNKVAGLYTNQDLIASTKGIKRGTPKETVLSQLGEPLAKIRKGMAYYQFEEDRDYDVFRIDGTYTTIFYDKHQKNTVTSIQMISEDLENNKRDFYSPGSPALMEGFEYQLFDLTNATRVNHNLSILNWDSHVRETARKHSADMAKNQYFSHTNLEGESPFDRMEDDGVRFMTAGENLATGQFSSVFAHEGLMNSMGHRKNILQKDFELLGVGVAFDSNSRPYYTENFYAK
ncbi:CAP domain-containing protein [Bacillus sp. V5-8f]|uniref:CAP domain-containing protein n=1 Tax=Bacillus sp. V5-8f TaxID=2053044 RepID=UPI000C77C197|nr:CAP domain-containing protein [Bacillus sp. V5-8f]PLT33425.1 serine protease [Bacillus sp. V5-8f]